jgi:ABC-type lipoprotein release transport system permease subunit
MFRVSGIYHFDIKDMDSGFAFVRLPVAQKMLGIGTGIHQIALTFDHVTTSTRADLPFWEKYSQNGNEAVSWTEIIPVFKAVSDMTVVSIVMLVVILGGVVVFGIINTLFMSLYERMFEFAVMRAVGTRPGGVRKLILLEAGALGVISIILGIVLAVILNMIFSHAGIDYRGIEFAGTTFHDLLYPEVRAWHFIVFPVGVIVFTVTVGLYPAFVAGRLKVAEALRKSL